MKKTIIITAIITGMLTACFLMLFSGTGKDVFLTFSVISGTTAYHFFMRLIVGAIYDRVMNNKADYKRRWFKEKKWEKSLYKRLGVKKWKNKMPTYEPDIFDASKHSLYEIAQAMCQAELVHETCFVLSFVPIIFIPMFGAPAAFIITSVVAACLELAFVMMQRYNRPRIVRLYERRSKKQEYKVHILN